MSKDLATIAILARHRTKAKVYRNIKTFLEKARDSMISGSDKYTYVFPTRFPVHYWDAYRLLDDRYGYCPTLKRQRVFKAKDDYLLFRPVREDRIEGIPVIVGVELILQVKVSHA